jgi:surface antigen
MMTWEFPERLKSRASWAIGVRSRRPNGARRAFHLEIWMGRAVIVAAMGALALAACATSTRVERTGSVPGANPGVVIDSPVGSGVGEAPVGALEGALLGADVGASLADGDRPIALQAEYEALEYGRSGQLTRWRNRKSGNGGEISVGSSYQVNRLECREYTHTVSIGGRNRVVRGTACRQPDGIWRVLG